MAACHCMNKGSPVPCPHMVPCGPPNSSTGFVQCCYGIDTCGADLFCRSTSTTGESGYYAGGCTDATYRDGSCSTQCGSQIGTQTIHSQSANKWICCFDNTKKTSNCSSPTNITFEAPSPEVLFAESFSIITASATSSSIPSIIPTSATGSSSTLNQNIEISTTSSTSSTAIQTVTTTVTTTATALADDSSSLSTDAKAGIGVGIVVLFIIGLGALLIWRRRSHHRQQQQPEEPFMRHSSILKVSPDVTVRQLNEVDASERHAELPNNNIVHQIA